MDHGSQELHTFSNLECPAIKLIETIIDKLGPGRSIYDMAVFDLDTPNPED